MEQSDKISKLYKIKIYKEVKFYEENGNLDPSVPLTCRIKKVTKYLKK